MLKTFEKIVVLLTQSMKIPKCKYHGMENQVFILNGWLVGSTYFYIDSLTQWRSKLSSVNSFNYFTLIQQLLSVI